MNLIFLNALFLELLCTKKEVKKKIHWVLKNYPNQLQLTTTSRRFDLFRQLTMQRNLSHFRNRASSVKACKSVSRLQIQNIIYIIIKMEKIWIFLFHSNLVL